MHWYCAGSKLMRLWQVVEPTVQPFWSDVEYHELIGRHWQQTGSSMVTRIRRTSILINGEPSVQFILSCGIRQEDLLSPYLFFIYTEGLSRLIHFAVASEHWNRITIGRNVPQLTHLFFFFFFIADDCLLFLLDNDTNFVAFQKVLRIYRQASGQQINFAESSIFFAKFMDEARKQWIAQRLGVSICMGDGKYLSLPYLIGKSKTGIFAYLKDMIWKKTHGWKEKILSRGGEKVLIKYVRI